MFFYFQVTLSVSLSSSLQVESSGEGFKLELEKIGSYLDCFESHGGEKHYQESISTKK